MGLPLTVTKPCVINCREANCVGAKPSETKAEPRRNSNFEMTSDGEYFFFFRNKLKSCLIRKNPKRSRKYCLVSNLTKNEEKKNLLLLKRDIKIFILKTLVEVIGLEPIPNYLQSRHSAN